MKPSKFVVTKYLKNFYFVNLFTKRIFISERRIRMERIIEDSEFPLLQVSS